MAIKARAVKAMKAGVRSSPANISRGLGVASRMGLGGEFQKEPARPGPDREFDEEDRVPMMRVSRRVWDILQVEEPGECLDDAEFDKLTTFEQMEYLDARGELDGGRDGEASQPKQPANGFSRTPGAARGGDGRNGAMGS
jgi:hypothetical protein